MEMDTITHEEDYLYLFNNNSCIITTMVNPMEKLKDLALEAIGKGEGAEFRDRVDATSKKYNLPPGEAQKRVFMEYLQNVKNEVGARKTFERGSKGIKSFETALREITGGAGIDMLKKTATQSALTRPKQFINITPQDQQAVEKYYERNYQKKPKHAICRDSAESVKSFDSLLNKFSNDPRVAQNPDVSSSLFDPDMGADIGQALLELDMFEKHERKFESRLNLSKSCESFKKSSVETLKTVFGKPLGDFMKSGYRFVKDPSISGAAKVGWEGTKYAAKTLTKGGEFLFNTARTTLSGANALRHAIT